MSKTILEVINAEKYYGEKGNVTKALDDISFSVNEGEFLGIMGASGSGKTTLLNCISTIDKLSAGKVLINGENINGLKGGKLDAFRRDELGFIFQDFNLLDNMTAFENIALALSIQKVNHKEIEERVEKIAKTLEITEVLEKFPYLFFIYFLFGNKVLIRINSGCKNVSFTCHHHFIDKGIESQFVLNLLR